MIFANFPRLIGYLFNISGWPLLFLIDHTGTLGRGFEKGNDKPSNFCFFENSLRSKLHEWCFSLKKWSRFLSLRLAKIQNFFFNYTYIYSTSDPSPFLEERVLVARKKKGRETILGLRALPSQTRSSPSSPEWGEKARGWGQFMRRGARKFCARLYFCDPLVPVYAKLVIR